MSQRPRATVSLLVSPLALAAALLLHAALAAALCQAHPAQYAAANVTIQADGRFHITVKFDLLAFALNDTSASIGDEGMNALMDGPGDELQRRLHDAEQRFSHGVTIRCDQPVGSIVRADEVQFPTAQDVYLWRDAKVQPRLPVMQTAALDGRLPPGTRAVSICFPEVMGTVVLTVERPAEEPYSEPLEPGQCSSLLPIQLPAEASANTRVSTLAPTVRRGLEWTAPAIRYLFLGFTHIVPGGADHVLFVLGLFLLNARLRPLLWQVTAFTVAHSITLGLALYGVMRVPAVIVEPLIALSIAVIAVENLFTAELKPWRPVVVFGFGLVHGLGFAGALRDIGLPRAEMATALVSFNLGVELGQLSVIALALGALGWWRQHRWYRRGIVMPASCAIALVALFWAAQRVSTGI